MNYSISLFFVLVSQLSMAQDTLKKLDLNSFLQHIKENHPIAIVASNDVLKAQQFIRMSKGAFDPLLFGGIDQKYYDGTTYYSTLNSGIKIPTRFGVNFKAMGELNRGAYVAPEEKTPAAGITYLGIEVPLGRGMFTDEQRTQLKRATVLYQQSSTQQQLILNDLLYEAGQHYINWQEQQSQVQLAQEVYELAKTRFEQVKATSQLGDRPDIDTVEASAQVFLRKIDLDSRKLALQNARLQIENYLWEKGTLPLTLEFYVEATSLELIIPQKIVETNFISDHPVMNLYDLKLKDLSLERKLKVEQLKPQFNLNYNLLQTPQNLISTNFTFTNYKWGASFYMPILLRKERSSLAMTALKIENTNIEMTQKQRDLETKQKQIRNEWNTLIDLAESSRIVYERYLQLSNAERSLFELGESSLFLINAREISFISSKGKYLEFLAKTNKSALAEKYILGQLWNETAF